MNVLYIHTSVISDIDVFDALQKSEHNVWEMSISYKDDDVIFAKKLLDQIEEKSIDVVIMLRYLPIVSITCNAIRIKYVSWICSSYDSNIYSYTLLNTCNYLFFSDYLLYQEFVENGIKNIYYLPLAANIERIQRILRQNEEIKRDVVDILMLQDIFSREKMGYNPLSPNSPLKDSTKGYLEGCIACQHQLSGLSSMGKNLPPYVREDLEKHFVPQMSEDSVEEKSHYYDYEYFNNLITYADREIHLHTWTLNKYAKTVALYGEHNSDLAKEIQCHNRVEYLTELPLAIQKGKINLVITHRNWKSGIPQISWDIMAAGGFLLSNTQEDFFRLFLECQPILFRNEKDMLSKGIYYLNHERERIELSQEIFHYICDRHTHKHRIEEIFLKI